MREEVTACACDPENSDIIQANAKKQSTGSALYEYFLSFCQVLTLASNERIPLNPTMRLVFEISHLRTATPATVSRAGSPRFPLSLSHTFIISQLYWIYLQMPFCSKVTKAKPQGDDRDI